MLKENKLILKISLLWIILYILISHFTLAAFPVKALLVSLIIIVHMNSKSILKEIIYIELPIFAIAYIFKLVAPAISGEWLLGTSLITYMICIYVYGKLKIILNKSTKF